MSIVVEHLFSLVKAHMMVWNMSFPEIMTGNRDVIVVELIGQLTDTYKVIQNSTRQILYIT